MMAGKSKVDGLSMTTGSDFQRRTMDADNKQFSIACENLDGCAGGDPEGTLRVLGGNDDSRQPEWSGSVSVAYVRDIGAGTLSANVGYKKVGLSSWIIRAEVLIKDYLKAVTVSGTPACPMMNLPAPHWA